MNKDLENKELQIEENEVLEEDLAKLPDNIKLELYTKYCALINDKFKELGKLPIIVVAVPKFDTYSQKEVAYNVNYIVKNVRIQNNRLLAKAVRSSKFAYVANSTPAELNILIDHLCLGDLTSGGKRKPRVNTDISDVWDYYGISEIKTDWFRTLLSEMIDESKQLKPDGRKAAVKATKKLDDFSAEAKNEAAIWFRDNIKSIRFDVVCGDVSKLTSSDYDVPYDEERENGISVNKAGKKLFGNDLDEFVNNSILNKQKTFLNDYNPAGIEEDQEQLGPDIISIGKNVTLHWKRAEKNLQKTLYWYITEFYNNTEIRFKTAVGNGPESVQSMIKTAIDTAKENEAVYKSANSNARNAYDPNATVISCNQLALMIVKGLFKGDLNFLANEITHASNVADTQTTNTLVVPKEPVSNTKREPEHELDLDFDDINAYGEIVQ